MWRELPEILLLVSAPFVGTFLSLVVKRLPRGRAIVFGRSSCEACGTGLAWYQMVPLVSWLWQRGRCRECGARFGPFYPLVELAALAIAVWSVWMTEPPVSIITAGLGFWLLALALIDYKHFLLPDRLTLPLIPLGLIVIAILNPGRLLDHIGAALLGAAALYALAHLYRALRGREGLGMGDVKLMAAAGSWVGVAGLPSVLLIASVSALLFLMPEALLKRRLRAGGKIPFGTFLCLGLFVTWLHGPIVGAI